MKFVCDKKLLNVEPLRIGTSYLTSMKWPVRSCKPYVNNADSALFYLEDARIICVHGRSVIQYAAIRFADLLP